MAEVLTLSNQLELDLGSGELSLLSADRYLCDSRL